MIRSTIPSALALAALLAAAGASRAQVAPAAEAPELAVDAWYNTPKVWGRSLRDFRGSAVFLEYWRTW